MTGFQSKRDSANGRFAIGGDSKRKALDTQVYQQAQALTLQKQLKKADANRRKANEDWCNANANRRKALADWDKAKEDSDKAEAGLKKAEADLKKSKALESSLPTNSATEVCE